MVIVHGFGEHSGRYAALAGAFADQGLSTVCLDFWGHGRSAGRRGDIEQFGQYLDDLDALLCQPLMERINPRGVAVFGHSFGGLVTIHWALRHPDPLRCLILQSPLLGVGFALPKWKERLAEFLGGVWRGLTLPLGLDPTWLSHDPDIAQRYQHDPLVHNRISLRCYQALQQAMRQALAQAARITTPTLVLYGTADRIISLQACHDFFNQLACEKRLIGFPDCYHELHHEGVRPRVVEAVSQWVQTRVC